MKKFMTMWDKITEVDVVGETAMFVKLHGGRKDAKMSSYKCYFDTWKEAHDHILEEAQIKVDSAKLSLERAKGKYGQIKGMKEPV